MTSQGRLNQDGVEGPTPCIICGNPIEDAATAYCFDCRAMPWRDKLLLQQLGAFHATLNVLVLQLRAINTHLAEKITPKEDDDEDYH
jgi:hypothetical protein